MWSMDYVQVPIEKPEKKIEEPAVLVEEKQIAKEKKKVDLVKQMSLNTEGPGKIFFLKCILNFFFLTIYHSLGVLLKSGSESSISEACDSVKESSKRYETEKDECSDNEKPIPITTTEIKSERKPSLVSAKSFHEFKDESKKTKADEERKLLIKIRCNSNIETEDDLNAVGTSKGDHHEEDGNKGRGIRPSKSDTSLTDSFVVVDSEYGGRKKGQGNQNILREGNCF